MAVISVEYGKTQSEYKAVVVVHLGREGRKERRFEGGMVEHDFPMALKFAGENGEEVLYSASCYNFVRDGWRYGWRTTDDGEAIYELSADELSRYYGWR